MLSTESSPPPRPYGRSLVFCEGIKPLTPTHTDALLAHGSAHSQRFDPRVWTGLDPPYDENAFYKSVSFDASTAGGAHDTCKDGLKAAWPRILRAGKSVAGRALLTKAFRTCSPIRPRTGYVDDPHAIITWASYPWATMAMGNYPYASSYIMHGVMLFS